MKDKYYLLSTDWFGKDYKIIFVHRRWFRNLSHPIYLFRGRQVIAICKTWSNFTTCNTHLHNFGEIANIFIEYVERSDNGCDFNFLIVGSGSEVSRDIHQQRKPKLC